MTADAKSWMEAIEKSYQFYVYLFTIFVVCMGVARWHGKQVWRKHEEARRESGGLPVAAFFSGNPEPGFTYTGLFQGGLMGVYIAATQLGYVVIMLGYDVIRGPIKPEVDIWGMVSGLMFFPILMLAYFVLITIFPFRSRISVRKCIFPVSIILVCVGGAFAAKLRVADNGLVVSVQLSAVAILSLCASYFIGMSEGIRSAEPETNYPLVNVELNQGAGFSQVWLYERTDSDYRLVTRRGTNHIVPAVNVKQIRKL